MFKQWCSLQTTPNQKLTAGCFFSPNILTRIHQQKYRYYVYDQQKLLCWTDFSAGIGQPQMLDRFFCWYWTKANVIFEARNWKFELSHTLADTTVRGVISMYLRSQVQFLYHEVPAGVKGRSSVLIWGK